MCPELVEAPFDRLRAHDNKCALSLWKRPSTGSSAHRYFGLPQPTA
jgi:hypothetical protein